MLNNATVKAARVKACAYKLWDADGLHLHVSTSGTKAWRFRCRAGGRERVMTLGQWPEVSLDEARARREDARRRLNAGAEPPSGPSAAATFADVARAWHAQLAPRWAPTHAADVLASLERHVLPELGALPLAAIDAAAVLRVVRAIERGGSIETARRVRQRISKVFRRAIAEQLVDIDPAALVKDALDARPEVRHQAALLEIDPVRTAYAAIAAAAAPRSAVLAAQLVALTAVRTAAARTAHWEEFAGLDDGAAPSWRIPAARMKLKRARKGDRANDHVVPLAPAAVQLLRAARAIAGDGPLVFPSSSAATAPIGANAILAVHRAAGLAGRHAPHGWRAAFATIMNERRPEDRAAIDLALAHSPKDKVEAAYNRSQQLERRRELLEDWAALLTPAPAMQHAST